MASGNFFSSCGIARLYLRSDQKLHTWPVILTEISKLKHFLAVTFLLRGSVFHPFNQRDSEENNVSANTDTNVFLMILHLSSFKLNYCSTQLSSLFQHFLLAIVHVYFLQCQI